MFASIVKLKEIPNCLEHAENLKIGDNFKHELFRIFLFMEKPPFSKLLINFTNHSLFGTSNAVATFLNSIYSNLCIFSF